MSKQEAQRERICQFYKQNNQLGNKATVDHFLAEGVSKMTIYNAIQRVKNNIGAQRRKGSGRPARKMTPNKVKRLQRHFDHKQGVSQRKAARKFGISLSYTNKLLKQSRIQCYRKKTIPDRSERQASEAKTKCRILFEKHKGSVWILDDESYFTLSHSTLASNRNFYSSDVSSTPSDVKLARKAKYEQKLLVWLAFSEKGISDVFIRSSGLAIDQHVYRQECLERRLIPFIKKHHSTDDLIFWPDLASSHYAESVCDFMMESKIPFVEKYENPANVPECRPIEKFWAILKGRVYADGWRAKNLVELERRIRDCIKKLGADSLAPLFKSLLPTLRHIGRYGVIEKQ